MKMRNRCRSMACVRKAKRLPSGEKLEMALEVEVLVTSLGVERSEVD